MGRTRQEGIWGVLNGLSEGRDLAQFVPPDLRTIDDPRTDLPRIAKDSGATARIASALRTIPTVHCLHQADARNLDALKPESVHLVLTSPPYWTLKQYNRASGQLGSISDYDEFLQELDRVWRHCFRTLVPGGRLICVVGDVCLSRRKNRGRHVVVPLHASIQEHCRVIGFDNLAPIIWYKIANAAYEVDGGSGFLGKPYEPNAIIKNDIEYVLMQRKPGAYRSPSVPARVLSVIAQEDHKVWFRQVWADVPGASTADHPAPFPLELAERLVRMYSFAGDIVLDPFMGTGTTNLAAARCGRNSIGVEIDSEYFDHARSRLKAFSADLFSKADVMVTRIEEDRRD